MPLADGGGGGSSATKKVAKERITAAHARVDSEIRDKMSTLKSTLDASDGALFKPDAILDTSRVSEAAPLLGPADPWLFYDSGHGVDWDPRKAGRQTQEDLNRDGATLPGAQTQEDVYGLLGLASASERGKTGKKDTRRKLQTMDSSTAAVSTKSRPEAEAKLNRETAEVARARDGSKLKDRGPVDARATRYDEPEKKDPSVEDLLKQLGDAEGRDNPFIEREVSGQSVDDLSTDESLAMTTRLAREALEKGLKGRAVQHYVQERQGMPGMERFQREETARLNKADVDEEMGESRERAARAGMNRGKGRDTETMTAEDYAALTPKQKAAVDLNTLLVAAVQRDMGVKRDEGKKYDDRVKAVFGADASTIQPFAPNTLSLLEDIGYKDDDTKVTDFLKLKAAFDADDVDDLKLRKGEAPDANLASAGFTRDSIQASLVESLQGARTNTDTRGDMMDTQRDLLGTNDRLGFGEADPTGDRTAQLNAYFQQAFEVMSTKGHEVKPEAIMSEARGRMDEREWKAFIEFLDVKSRESKQFDIPLGTDPETEYKPTRKFRAQLQLNK